MKVKFILSFEASLKTLRVQHQSSRLSSAKYIVIFLSFPERYVQKHLSQTSVQAQCRLFSRALVQREPVL